LRACIAIRTAEEADHRAKIAPKDITPPLAWLWICSVMLCSMLKALWGMTVFECSSKKSNTGWRFKKPSNAKRKIMNGKSEKNTW
jgi:hypothetical protein